jgi:hypothetical protein
MSIRIVVLVDWFPVATHASLLNRIQIAGPRPTTASGMDKLLDELQAPNTHL